MGFTIDIEACRKQMFLNVMRPQEVVPRQADGTLPEGWSGTNSQGLPVKQIPIIEYPKVVYLHPNEPTRKIVHRNLNHEIVEEELIPTEHLTKMVQNEAELKAALEEGWCERPYIPAVPEKPDSGLYGPRKIRKETKQ